MRNYYKLFRKIICSENLFLAWDEFKRGKTRREDVLEFDFKREEKVFALQRELQNKTYRHSPYASFRVCDPKPRQIHKATVRDRLVHHAVFRILNQVFEPSFIAHSFSCRIGKGNHRGVSALAGFLRKASHNNSRPCFVLKCDVRKFFASVNHDILKKIIRQKVKDEKALWLVEEIINSFSSSNNIISERERESKESLACGLPIGNLTSQLFANIYLNELDQFVKQKLKIKHYARYTDDFVMVSVDENYLKIVLEKIMIFLQEKLKLDLHPDKVFIRKYSQGADFLGYVVRPNHILLRTKTERRIFNKMRRKAKELQQGIIDEDKFKESLNSYLAVLSHADAHELAEELKNIAYF